MSAKIIGIVEALTNTFGFPTGKQRREVTLYRSEFPWMLLHNRNSVQISRRTTEYRNVCDIRVGRIANSFISGRSTLWRTV